MNFRQWKILDNWPIDNQRRIILKNRGSHLIDITTDEETINEIVSKVRSSSWTNDELMDYLSEKGLAVSDNPGSKIVNFVARRYEGQYQKTGG